MKDKINFFEEKELGNTKATITQAQEGGFYTVHIKDGEENILLKQYKTLLGARKCVNNYITTPSAKKESDVIFKPSLNPCYSGCSILTVLSTTC